MKEKINKLYFYSLIDHMCIVVCDYHVIILVSNKNERYVVNNRHIILFQIRYYLILKNSCAHGYDMWHIHKYFYFYLKLNMK
jgi:hypothetical protein